LSTIAGAMRSISLEPTACQRACSIACATQKVHIARVAIRYNRSATNVLAAI
jgi:hypothetical protein